MRLKNFILLDRTKTEIVQGDTMQELWQNLKKEIKKDFSDLDRDQGEYPPSVREYPHLFECCLYDSRKNEIVKKY